MLAHFLRLTSNNACSTRKAEQLLEWIQADGDTTRTYQEMRDFLIRSHIRDIRFNKKEIARVEGELHRMMQQLDLQLETMPGIDLVTSSALVAEIGDIHRFASADKLARFAGIAPVKNGFRRKARQSEKQTGESSPAWTVLQPYCSTSSSFKRQQKAT